MTMRLTGEQVKVIANISDGANVVVTNFGTYPSVRVHRIEDDLIVNVDTDGAVTTLKESREE